jgi:hypothetical protein
MNTKYGLHVESPFDPKSANMVTVTVKKGEIKKIERTVHGLLVVKIEDEASLVYIENIILPGLYHTYVYMVGKNSKIFINSKIKSEIETSDISHKIYLDGDDNKAEVISSGVATLHSEIVYTSGIYIKEETTGCHGSQQAKFLIVGDQATVSAIPEISTGTQEGAIEHGLSIKHITEREIEYLSMRGQNKEQATRTIIDGFIE